MKRIALLILFVSAGCAKSKPVPPVAGEPVIFTQYAGSPPKPLPCIAWVDITGHEGPCVQAGSGGNPVVFDQYGGSQVNTLELKKELNRLNLAAKIIREQAQWFIDCQRQTDELFVSNNCQARGVKLDKEVARMNGL